MGRTDYKPIVAIFLINVKKLIDEMNNGELKSPFNRGPESSVTTRLSVPARASQSGIATPVAAASKHNPALDMLKRAFPGHGLPAATKQPRISVDEAPQMVDRDGRGSRPDTNLVGALFSCIMSWGMDESLDEFCVKELKLVKPGAGTIGCRGAGGYVSFPVPSSSTTPQSDWFYSNTLTAQRLLTIVAMVRSLVTNYELSHDVVSLMRKFGCMVPDTESNYKLPSLSVLVKFWQDSIPDIQEATRFIISRTLTTMTAEQLDEVLKYWIKFIPVKEPIRSKTSCRAAVVLGLTGSILPQSLTTRVCKDVCVSLDAIIKDPSKNPYRLLAIEIIGFGFKAWEPHLNGSSVLRTLVLLTGLTGQQSTNASFLSPPNMIMARQSVLQIASVNPGLFVSVLTFDLIHAKDVWEKVGILKLFGLFITRVFFINKKPVLLYPHVISLVDAMVKQLDPNNPAVRESLQNMVTINFAELVKLFPTIAFHPLTQRLAVGTLEGTSVIYDLRTATKINVLEVFIVN